MAVQIHLMIIQIHLMIVQIILMSVQIHLMIVQIHLMIAQINRALTLTSKCPVCSPSINLTTRFSKQVQRPDTYGHRENPAQVEVPDKHDSLPTGHTAYQTFSRGSALAQIHLMIAQIVLMIVQIHLVMFQIHLVIFELIQ